LKEIKENFYHPKMDKDIRDYVATCEKCQQFNHATKINKGEMRYLEAETKGQIVGIDLCSGMGRTKRNNKYIMVITDYLTKYVVIVPIPNKKAATVARAIITYWVAYFDWPKEIISDKGTEFQGVVDELCKEYDVIHHTTVGYRPQANGQVERFNRSMGEMISKTITDKREWDEVLPTIMWEYNNSTHTTTGFKPIFLATGQAGRRFSNRKEDEKSTIANGLEEMWKALEVARTNILEKRRKDAQREEIISEKFDIGDEVLIRQHNQTNMEARRYKKLMKKYDGPWRVKERIGENGTRYKITRAQEEKIVHVSEMKTYNERPEWMKIALGEKRTNNEKDSEKIQAQKESDNPQTENTKEITESNNETIETFNPKELKIGERVEIRLNDGEGNHAWYCGSVQNLNKRGKVIRAKVEFDDGEMMEKVEMDKDARRCSHVFNEDPIND
jgi:hypothetical protein